MMPIADECFCKGVTFKKSIEAPQSPVSVANGRRRTGLQNSGVLLGRLEGPLLVVVAAAQPGPLMNVRTVSRRITGDIERGAAAAHRRQSKVTADGADRPFLVHRSGVRPDVDVRVVGCRSGGHLERLTALDTENLVDVPAEVRERPELVLAPVIRPLIDVATVRGGV